MLDPREHICVLVRSFWYRLWKPTHSYKQNINLRHQRYIQWPLQIVSYWKIRFRKWTGMQRRDTKDHSWGHSALIHSLWLGSSLRLCALTARSWCGAVIGQHLCRWMLCLWMDPPSGDTMSVKGPTQWGMLCLWMDPHSREYSEMRSSCNFYPGQLLFTTFNLLVTQSPNTYFFSQLDWDNNSPNIMPL